MKKLLSYVLPYRIKKYNSAINGELEINLVNGKKKLDTHYSNYSYGSLQRILRKGLIATGFNSEITKILLLGLGGGSVIETIREDFQSNATLVAVDLDPVIISIAENDFQIKKFKNIQIIHADATEYINNTEEKYDLIIVDLFIGNTIPANCTEKSFLINLENHLEAGGNILFNIMRETMPAKLFLHIKNSFAEAGLKVRILEEVEWTNDLVIAKKIPMKQGFQ